MPIIGQGTYGCVYDSIPCASGQTDPSRTQSRPQARPDPWKTRKVTKVQLAASAANEFAIAKIIVTLPSYWLHFAPLEKKCPLSVERITTDPTFRICKPVQDAVQEPGTSFVQGDLRYLGKRNIIEYLWDKAVTSPQLAYFVDTTYRYAEGNLHKLRELRIVHYDLHQGNILYDEYYGVPVIIDFGMAMVVQEDDRRPLLAYDIFFSTDVDFSPWCIEVVLLSHLKRQEAHPDARSHGDVMTDALARFVAENPVCLAFPEVAQHVQKKVTTVYLPVTDRQELVHQLLGTWKHWDAYSLAVMFRNFLAEMPAEFQESQADLIAEWMAKVMF